MYISKYSYIICLWGLNKEDNENRQPTWQFVSKWYLMVLTEARLISLLCDCWRWLTNYPWSEEEQRRVERISWPALPSIPFPSLWCMKKICRKRKGKEIKFFRLLHFLVQSRGQMEWSGPKVSHVEWQGQAFLKEATKSEAATSIKKRQPLLSP